MEAVEAQLLQLCRFGIKTQLNQRPSFEADSRLSPSIQADKSLALTRSSNLKKIGWCTYSSTSERVTCERRTF